MSPYDIAAVCAHARMLAAQAIIADDDRDALLAALDAVEAELAAGSFPFDDDDEDIHMAVERRLTEIAGPVGGKLHTARSRNDQVATDLTLFARDAAGHAARAIDALAAALVDAAEAHLDWPLPGYTHLQRAQPVYLSHHLLAYVWMLLRDRERFVFAAAETAALPLGAGALAGVDFDTDRAGVAEELGFERVAPNSIDAVSNRDFVLDSSPPRRPARRTSPARRGARALVERGVRLPHAVGRVVVGSSIMPQKKNPDAAELLAPRRRASSPTLTPCTA